MLKNKNGISKKLIAIRIYLNAQDTTHIYTLLGFHLRSHPWQKDATSALPKPAGSANDATQPIEPVENLPLSTARILAMLVRFGYFKLHHIWSLLQIPSGSPYPDLPLKGSEAATSNADESLTADEMFALSPKLQMLTALLEVPDDAPLAFIRDQSDLNELFLETLQPFIFQVKRVANVFSSRAVTIAFKHAYIWPCAQPSPCSSPRFSGSSPSRRGRARRLGSNW